VDVLANRLVFVVVTAALLVGSSLWEAVGSDDPEVTYLGFHVVSLVGFILALVMATILLTIIFRSRRL
jgi:ubiquinone biosynthesis protein